MPSLEELLRGGQGVGAAPGINPELEQMLSRISALQTSGVKGPGGGMPPGPGVPMRGAPGTMGQGGQPPGIAAGTPTGQGTPMASMSPGEQQPMQPQQANMTYQALIKAGVPEQVAKQAMGSPKLLQEILAQMQKAQGQGGGPAGAINNPMAVAGVRG